MTKEQEKIAKNNEELIQKLQNEKMTENKYECNICCENVISRALSCGHAFCANCTTRFFNSKCPNCNQVPQGFQKIYFS